MEILQKKNNTLLYPWFFVYLKKNGILNLIYKIKQLLN